MSLTLSFLHDAVAEWASDALLGMGKGAPFSLCLTQKHFSQVVAAHGNDTDELSKVCVYTSCLRVVIYQITLLSFPL